MFAPIGPRNNFTKLQYQMTTLVKDNDDVSAIVCQAARNDADIAISEPFHHRFLPVPKVANRLAIALQYRQRFQERLRLGPRHSAPGLCRGLGLGTLFPWKSCRPIPEEENHEICLSVLEAGMMQSRWRKASGIVECWSKRGYWKDACGMP